VQLDQNRIAIRERSYPDLLDLGLRVIRAYAGPLAAAFLLGVAPLMALNCWLLADYVEADFPADFPATYMWYLLQLVVWQMPLATAPITLYLGQAVFRQRPRPAELLRDFRRALPQLLWYQVIFRALTIPVVWIWLLSISDEVQQVLANLLVVGWYFLFVTRPYLNEVILLERNPMRRRPDARITTARRARALHRGSYAELFARWIGAAAVGAAVFLSLWGSLALLGGTLFNQWGGAMYLFCFQLALWVVLAYMSVVRYLGYLDLRIRREGWEVELLMRAEGARLTRQLT